MSNEEDAKSQPPAEEADADANGAEETPEPTEVELLTAERDKLKDQLLRTAADFDNFRKRTKKDLDEALQRGKEDALREVLPIIDNLERAVAAAADAPSTEAVAEGVQMVLRQFEDASSRIGLARVASVGERFDPAVHDAVQQLQTEDHPAGTVVAEVVPGYKLGARLLRPAMVVVAKPPTAPSQNPEDAGPKEEAE